MPVNSDSASQLPKDLRLTKIIPLSTPWPQYSKFHHWTLIKSKSNSWITNSKFHFTKAVNAIQLYSIECRSPLLEIRSENARGRIMTDETKKGNKDHVITTCLQILYKYWPSSSFYCGLWGRTQDFMKTDALMSPYPTFNPNRFYPYGLPECTAQQVSLTSELLCFTVSQIRYALSRSTRFQLADYLLFSHFVQCLHPLLLPARKFSATFHWLHSQAFEINFSLLTYFVQYSHKTLSAPGATLKVYSFVIC